MAVKDENANLARGIYFCSEQINYLINHHEIRTPFSDSQVRQILKNTDLLAKGANKILKELDYNELPWPLYTGGIMIGNLRETRLITCVTNSYYCLLKTIKVFNSQEGFRELEEKQAKMILSYLSRMGDPAEENMTIVYSVLGDDPKPKTKPTYP